MSVQEASGKQRLGWHWLWFGPLCLVVLLLVERQTLTDGFMLLALGYHRWSWGVLFSPSAFFCLSIIWISVVWPILGLTIVATLVKLAKERSARRRALYLVLLVIGIFLLPFVTEALNWGSFPFIIDDQGVSRLRSIPFIPWPAGHFGEY
jgi:hypothetical protein